MLQIFTYFYIGRPEIPFYDIHKATKKGNREKTYPTRNNYQLAAVDRKINI